MAVWKKIADEMSDDDSSVLVTATQCKQKWKNINKKFRDCVDYNSKTGNDKKECPFYHELQDCYGYRPNVHPQYTASSSRKAELEDASTSSTEETTSVSQPVTRKKATKTDEIVSVLKNLQGLMKDDQNKLLEILEKQHQDRVKQEDKKLELLSSLISNLKK